MKFTAGGPSVPNDIVEAAEDEELLLFCGAGISRPAGLPSFQGLTKNIYEETGAEWREREKQEFDSGNYDRVLNLLERQSRLGPEKVREVVYQQLQAGEEPDLSTHEAILDLARTQEETVRLVTTNFDRLFEEAADDLRIASAPMLPPPKPHRWKGLVYLHGRLGDNPDQNEELVLTSGDFGRAYMVEGWASRFVSELFQHFTVVFVGYGVEDPVLRYMIDAFAAEQQRRGEVNYRAFAFAAYAEGEKEAKRRDWEAKGIEPILYQREGTDHSRLHETLREWARVRRGGLRSRQNIVQENAAKKPEQLSPEQVDLIKWALSDEVGARTFAKLGKEANIDWLPVLDEEGLLGSKEEYASNPPIVDYRRQVNERASLAEATTQLGEWLTSHLEATVLVEWIVENGAHLHPDFRRIVLGELDLGGETVEEPYRTIWRLLTARGEVIGQSSFDRGYDVLRRLEGEAWDEALRSDFLALLQPRLDLSSASRYQGFFSQESGSNSDDTDDPSESLETVGDILWVDGAVEAGQLAGSLIQTARKREDWDEILSNLRLDIFMLLRRALELFEWADQADEHTDPSSSNRPAIEPHDQNHGLSDWTCLIDLGREVIDKASVNSEILNVLGASGDWLLFRRFLLYYFRKHSRPSVDKIVAKAEEDPVLWIWATRLKTELFPILPKLWDQSDEKGREVLSRLLVEGPPRDMFVEDLEHERWVRIREMSKWERIIRIREKSEEPLTEEMNQTLREIEVQFPDLEFTDSDKERFSVWSESSHGYSTDFTTRDLLSLPDDELIDILTGHQDNRRGLMEAWRHAVAESPNRMTGILGDVADTPDSHTDVWASALRGASDTECEVVICVDLLDLLSDRSDEILVDVIHPAARFLEQIAPTVADSARDQFFYLWNRLLPLSQHKHPTDRSSWVNVALNHPTGKLSEAIVRLFRRDVDNGEGLQRDTQKAFEKLLRLEAPFSALTIAIIGSRLPVLYAVASEWTQTHIIPKLAWEEEQDASLPTGAWQGYLWGASVNPSLWSEIKPHFLDALDNLDVFENRNIRTLSELLALVSIDFSEGLTSKETRTGLRKVKDTGRAAVAHWLQGRLKGAGERAAELWREQIGPWIETVWPPEQEYRSVSETEELGLAVIEAQEAFPEAVRHVDDFLGRIGSSGAIIFPLREKGHDGNHPEAALELLNLVVGDNLPPYSAKTLGKSLEAIGEADPKLKNDPRFERLSRIATEGGWELE